MVVYQNQIIFGYIHTLNRTVNRQTNNLLQEQKNLPIIQHALEMPGDIMQKLVTHGSITRKMITRIIYFNHITTATTPLRNQ